MISYWLILTLSHLIGLELAVGAATVKLALMMKGKSDPQFIPIFLKVSRPITRIIISGLILLTLSGIGWILAGTSFTTLFIVKIVLVLVVWTLGPLIDNAVEPKYVKLAPVAGNEISAEFISIQNKLILLETIATLDFYVIIVLGVLI